MKRKYLPITVPELTQMLATAKTEYQQYVNLNAQYLVATEGMSHEQALAHPLYNQHIQHLKNSTGIFDEAMRRAARDYSEEKYQLLDNYYRYTRVETAWGTRLWMNIFYNLMGFPKTFWLMRHFKWLL